MTDDERQAMTAARIAELQLGCGTHGCDVRRGPLSGMGTNGRCRCADRLRMGELRFLLAAAEALAGAVEGVVTNTAFSGDVARLPNGHGFELGDLVKIVKVTK